MKHQYLRLGAGLFDEGRQSVSFLHANAMFQNDDIERFARQNALGFIFGVSLFYGMTRLGKNQASRVN